VERGSINETETYDEPQMTKEKIEPDRKNSR